MAYSRIKVWIAAEILTASDLNAEHTGHINNENDLNTRLVAEISTRSTLEGEHDTLKNNLWSSANNQVADNRVGQASMKDSAVHTAELKAGAVTDAKVADAIKDPAAGTAGLRTLGTGALQACAGNDSRLAFTEDASISQAKLKTSQGSVQLNHATGTISQLFTLPGGEYGFYPQIKFRVTNSTGREATGKAQIFHDVQDSTYDSGYITRIYLTLTDNETSWPYLNTQQRYVTASGEVFWIFILRNRVTKKIGSMWQAPDHPCFGNGGKPLLTPHPFGNFDESKHEIIVINPTNKEIEQMELETIVDDIEYNIDDLFDFVKDETMLSFEYPEYNNDPEDTIVAMTRKDIVALFNENKINQNTKFWTSHPDKDLLEVITGNYEIDEGSNPAWPSIPVTVGLPKHIKDKKTGKKTLADYRFMGKDDIVQPIKKVIPQPLYVKVKELKRK